ncbi:lipoyl protein ligase domain-containing protein [Chondromyces apiculatus]|uniref:BPL/LPL catalytic domain-containing protein n=1 Tax=Chondromyces apiculatus DSM 436 TaxID=1192034 RepID=A0A017T5V9_9BACT|nr:hypothetical protein [Chondromyces apiculatus]EYF04412.1 Hypothetical protein CAP_4551 [Chondromyces apiculatus DSM 436]
MRYLPGSGRSLGEAISLAPVLLQRAREEGVPWMAGSVVEGPAILLGAAQRAGRVVDLGRCAAAGIPVMRRATTGTAVYLGQRGVMWALALPHVAALAPDATARTLLNRNVRGFLKGFGRAGAIGRYFGREWISVKHRPAAVLAVETAPDGAAVLEVWAGYEVPAALPEAVLAPEEQAVDRWLGKAPAALVEVLPAGTSIEALLRACMDAVGEGAQGESAGGERGGDALRAVEEAVTAAGVGRQRVVSGAFEPAAPGSGPFMIERAPIGWIEAAALPGGGGGGAGDGAAGGGAVETGAVETGAVETGAVETGAAEERGVQVWVGGDMLTGTWVLDAIGRGARRAGGGELRGGGGGEPALREPEAVVMDGATLDALVSLASRARSVSGH